MKKIIYHIRKQPESVRRNILHILTIMSGLVLISLWVYSLNTSFNNKNTQEKIERDLKPFSIIKDNVISPTW